jgi:nucleotide-binding universal stress UspA family protein
MKRILVAVDDSPQALAAADVAIDLARSQGAALRLVTVREQGRDPVPALHYVTGRARAAGLDTSEAVLDGGQPFERLLREAGTWLADLIVMGRSDKRPTGTPYVGSQTEHLLEFTTVPVLVVPSDP